MHSRGVCQQKSFVFLEFKATATGPCIKVRQLQLQFSCNWCQSSPVASLLSVLQLDFETLASEDESAGPAPIGNHNKVGARSSGSSSSKQMPPSSSNPEMDGTEMHQEFIAALHKWWKCDVHMKDSGNPVYCYNPPSTNVYYQLSHNSISYWAVQIGKGRATVDKKPLHVTTQAARPCTRNVGSGLVTDSDHQMAQNHIGPGPMSYPYPATPFFMPPWPAPVQAHDCSVSSGANIPISPTINPTASHNDVASTPWYITVI
ncbi:hypothetical protein BU15DRAFT_66155 [Melanogaster broomeanus]|nr:hypothetical protein BU15DRAFT_66155 [Melanogaster broomeanus]